MITDVTAYTLTRISDTTVKCRVEEKTFYINASHGALLINGPTGVHSVMLDEQPRTRFREHVAGFLANNGIGRTACRVIAEHLAGELSIFA
jgi:hypothetical protein